MGGMENGLVNLVNNMDPARFRHAIACVEDYTDFRERVQRADVEVIALRRSETGVWRLRKNIYDLCRGLRPAIVHSRGLSGLDALLPARLAGVEHRVHGEHGWDVHDLHGEAFRPTFLRRMHSPLISRYVTVSDHLARYLIDRVRVHPSRIVHICNGVDTGRFLPAADVSRDLLPERFRSPDALIVGTVGRLQAVKDHATLIRAVAKLSRDVPDLASRVRLAIVGDGPLQDDIVRLVREEGFEDRSWLPGAAEDVPGILRSFDLFVMPSLMEGISNTILEAMASGLPVVATAVGGNPELVEDHSTGELFVPGDIDALARMIGDYARDERKRRDHGAAARRRAVEHFSLDVMVGAYQALYEEILTP